MPSRKAKRPVYSTALLFGEGEHDTIFLRHLVASYCRRGQSAKITVRKGRGSAADSVVDDARRVPGDYNRRLVKLDNDKPKKEIAAAFRLAKEHNISLAFSTPCLEGLLLSILDSAGDYRNRESEWCKRKLERENIVASKRGSRAHLQKIFTKRKMNAARKRIPELDKLIKFIEKS